MGGTGQGGLDGSGSPNALCSSGALSDVKEDTRDQNEEREEEKGRARKAERGEQGNEGEE